MKPSNISQSSRLVACAVVTAMLSACGGESGNLQDERAQDINRDPYFISTNGWVFHEGVSDIAGFYTALALDDDGDSFTFAIAPGEHDAQYFHIDADTGLLSFIETPDFENPKDQDGDNKYRITLTVSDGRGGHAKFPLTVYVEDQSYEGSETTDTLPVFFEQLDTVYVSYDASGVVYDAHTRIFDMDGGTLSFGPVDSLVNPGSLEMDATTGQLRVVGPLDRSVSSETLRLTVSDRSPPAESHMYLEIIYHEGETPPGYVHNPHYPVITSLAVAQVDRFTGTAPFYTAIAQDADGTDLTFFIVSEHGPYQLLQIDPVTGDVSFKEEPDLGKLSKLINRFGHLITFVIGVDDGQGKKAYTPLTLQIASEE